MPINSPISRWFIPPWRYSISIKTPRPVPLYPFVSNFSRRSPRPKVFPSDLPYKLSCPYNPMPSPFFQRICHLSGHSFHHESFILASPFCRISPKMGQDFLRAEKIHPLSPRKVAVITTPMVILQKLLLFSQCHSRPESHSKRVEVNIPGNLLKIIVRIYQE